MPKLARFSADPAITSITESQFEKEGDENSVPQTNRIIDQDAVLKVVDKVNKGQSLNAQDKEVIDPTKAKAGVNRTAKFSERFKGSKASLGV